MLSGLPDYGQSVVQVDKQQGKVKTLSTANLKILAHTNELLKVTRSAWFPNLYVYTWYSPIAAMLLKLEAVICISPNKMASMMSHCSYTSFICQVLLAGHFTSI